MTELTGQKTLVFGGTSGIGLATAIKLRDLGANVVAISRDPDKAAGLAGLSLEACDVRDATALQALLVKHAPLDILISAATGGERASGPFLAMDMDAYQNSFDKLWGYANVLRYGAPLLKETGSITLVSGSPARKARAGQSALASVGGAIEQLVRAVAPEIAPKRLNVVSPGLIDTPMFGDDAAERRPLLEQATAGQLIPRPGTAEEVADGIIFLVQNRFATGTTVDVDGGWLLS